MLVYKELVERNIRSMIDIAGDVNRLRPHIKTHKCAAIIDMMLQYGINKFKCATLAEAELLAQRHAPDVLLAYQLSGPLVSRFRRLIESYPDTKFSTLVDNLKSAQNLNDHFLDHPLAIYIDLDLGMHRTGISPNKAQSLLNSINQIPGLKFMGWHAYDGHIRDSEFETRKQVSDEAFGSVQELVNQSGVAEVIAGGSPTFPVHALRPQVELSPGTSVLWDYRYKQILPDLPFEPAAVLLCRVISKPGGDLICLDLGHKAVASEMPHPRVHLLDLEVVEFTNHSEEHLVVRTPEAPNYEVGDVLYGIPMHICPTSALHQEFLVVSSGKVVDAWPIGARDRRISI